MPQFAPPPTRPLDPPLPEVDEPSSSQNPTSPPPTPETGPANLDAAFGSAARGMLGKAKQFLAPREDRTTTFSDGEWQPEKAAALFVGLVTAGVSLLALVVRLRTGGHTQLRKPDHGETDDIADPLGRMFFRRVDLDRWGPDLVDTVMLVSATSAYASNGPLFEPAAIEAGLPENGESA